MQIEEIGSQENSEVGNRSRAAEIRRLAQSMAAERLASAKPGGTGNGNSLQQDSVKLSNAALSQVSSRNSAASSNRTQQLLGSIMEKLDSQILNPDSEFNRQKKDAVGVRGGGGKKKVKRKAEWRPTAKEGQVHHGREVIGKIRVTTEVKEQSGDGGSAKGVPPSETTSAGARPSRKSTLGQAEHESEKESQPADQSEQPGGPRAAQALNSGASQASASSGAAGGSGGGGKVEEFDVKGQAFGMSQTMTIESAKELGPGNNKLGTFRRLDDKPMLKYVTTHSRDTKQASKELKKKALAAGETPDAVKKALEMLRDKSKQ